MTELWQMLSADMRSLRLTAGMSLRAVEAESGIGRGTLSLVENGRARPNRRTVEWYDAAFRGDGLLTSMFAEARGARGFGPSARPGHTPIDPRDSLAVREPALPFGVLLPTGDTLSAAWTLVNTGRVEWRDRSLLRVGAPHASRLITSAPAVPVPDCRPGDKVRAEAGITIPEIAGTYAAYWQMSDAEGRTSLALNSDLAVLVVARWAD